jgi:hypothetical protein|tara:strand:+ start:1170 stop:1400 length:231 start_codon:yes stop_codon:yes gene_type:complete
MTEEKNVYTFKAGDIFEDIKDDPSNVLMNIPPEISEKMGWVEGDVLDIKLYEDTKQISITKLEDTDSLIPNLDTDE